MRLLKRLGVLTLCIGLAFSSSIVSASEWQLPTVGTTIPGGIPGTGRQYVVELNVVDAATGEAVDSEKYHRGYDWYVSTFMGATTTNETSKVKISYRLAEWDGGIDGAWFNVTDVIEKEVDIVDGWNFTFIELEGTTAYTIGVCKEVEDPVPDEDKSDNNYLASLEVERGTIEPSFTPENMEYTLQLEEDVDELTIHVKPQDEKASVVQETIITPLSKGKNKIGITVKAENKTQRYYSIMVMCGNGETSSVDDDKQQSSGGSGSGSQGRYNTSRDLGNFSKVPHVATKVSTSGTMISNSGLTAQQAVEGLTPEQKEQILKSLKQKIPYTSLGYTLTANELKSATQNIFTDAQLGEILASKELMQQIGINLDEIVTTVSLKNTGDVAYNDISDTDSAKTDIEEAISLGILESSEDGKFYPGSSIKIEDAFKFLDRILLLNHMETMKLGRSTVELYFKDINVADYPYIGSVASKLQVKTTKNLAAKKLGENLTKQEMAQMIYEITEGKLEVNNEEIYIADIDDNTYEPALNYAVKAGLMELTNDSITPSANLTKAETMKILMKLNKAIINMQTLEAQAKEDEANNKVIADAMSDPIAEEEEKQ